MFEVKRVGKAKIECVCLYKEMKVEDGERQRQTNKRQARKSIGRKEVPKEQLHNPKQFQLWK